MCEQSPPQKKTYFKYVAVTFMMYYYIYIATLRPSAVIAACAEYKTFLQRRTHSGQTAPSRCCFTSLRVLYGARERLSQSQQMRLSLQ